MRTALVILAVLVGTLAMPMVAGTVYQVIETWRAGPASKDASQSVSRDARGNDWHNALAGELQPPRKHCVLPFESISPGPPCSLHRRLANQEGRIPRLGLT